MHSLAGRRQLALLPRLVGLGFAGLVAVVALATGLVGCHAAPKTPTDSEESNQVNPPPNPATAGSQVAGPPGTAVFSPTEIPLSAPEIANPGRGQFAWLTPHGVPESWPTKDLFYRDNLKWGIDLEPRRGVYNFSSIDEGIAKAHAMGGRLSFRVMALCPGCGDNVAPSYVPEQRPKLPDWNSEEFVSGFEKLMAALGKKYNKNPGIGFIDIGGYGPWGEWFEGPEYGEKITTANGTRLIKAAVQAFPDKYVLVNLMERFPDIAVKMSDKVGFRMDCVGGMDIDLSWSPVLRNVWKKAPAMGDWCNAPQTTVERGIKNVKSLHMSMISSGNYPRAYSAMSSKEKRDWDTLFKIAGYRYVLQRLTIPTGTAAGAPLKVTTTWLNAGVAPTYDPWRVELRLHDGTGKIAWRGPLSDSLRTVLPGNKSFTSTINITPELRGTFTVSLAVVDPSNYLKPMNLAITGKSPDGSYKIGTITLT